MSHNIPYILADRTGELERTEFIDLNNRLKLGVVPSRDCSLIQIYNSARMQISPIWRDPDVTLQFGANHALGDIHWRGCDGIRMVDYLPRVLSE
jgi:hypothetical protein